MIPNPNEFLIVVLGGPSEGESIVVHLGDNRWMIIDSGKVGNDVMAVKYFVDNGIPFENVDIIVCTHWHADHVYLSAVHQVLSMYLLPPVCRLSDIFLCR